MAVGGLPNRNSSNPVDTALTALRMLQFTLKEKEHEMSWDIRMGINTGRALVGVIGKKRFAYDIWRASVNLDSRMEETAEKNTINITKHTYERIKDLGTIPMCNLRRIKPELSEDEEGYLPNRKFINRYNKTYK